MYKWVGTNEFRAGLPFGGIESHRGGGGGGGGSRNTPGHVARMQT